jgi:membrane protein implicated in regulation of membrane protease activity
MHRRMKAWLIFFAIISVIGVGAVTKMGHQIDIWFHVAIWSFLVAVSVMLIWQVFHNPHSRERQRLIDSRGLHIWPRSWRRWLFDENSSEKD